MPPDRRRLLFVCKSLPFTFKGGIQTHVWELTRRLLALGHEVTILTAGSWQRPTETVEREGRRIVYLRYLPGRRVPGLRKSLEDVSFNVAALLWLRRRARAYDCVHLQGRSGCLYPALVPRAARVPTVATFHRLLEVEYTYDGQATGRLDGFVHRRLMGWAELTCARRADRLVAVSEEMHRELLDAVGAAGLRPVHLLPNGVSEDFGAPLVERSERWQLCFVGRLERIKGVYTLLRALARMDERIELVFVGDGPERSGLERIVRRRGLQHRVRFAGNQDSDAVRYWMQRSYALVLPSFHETQGIVLLEAGICGRPVLAASAPGIDEVVQHGVHGLMFPAGDAVSLAVVADYLFDNPKLARRLGEAGRRQAQARYDWGGIAEATARVYEELCRATVNGVEPVETGEAIPERRKRALAAPNGVAFAPGVPDQPSPRT